MAYLKLKYYEVEKLKPHARNPRKHSKKQVRKIAESMQFFGFNNPVLIDANDRIVAGHGRIEAAKLLGIKKVPTVRLEHMTEDQIRAYVLADNRLAEIAGWDEELLALELQDLTELEIDFDVTITGFEAAEIDLLIGSLDSGEEDAKADAVPEVDPLKPPVSRSGDLWLLGRHRLLCGNRVA